MCYRNRRCGSWEKKFAWFPTKVNGHTILFDIYYQRNVFYIHEDDVKYITENGNIFTVLSTETVP